MRANAASGVMVIVVLLGSVSLGLAEEEGTVRSQVRVIPQPTPTDSTPALVTAPVLPQEEPYVTRHADTDSVAESTTFRLAVLLPERPVTLGVRVWIDGTPYWDTSRLLLEKALSAVATEARQGASREDDASNTQEAGDELQAKFAEYARATGRVPQQEEARWLMQKWKLGPRVAQLRAAFEPSVSRRVPVFEVLDADDNESLGDAEVRRATAALRAADFDRDGVLSSSEIERKSRRAPRGGWQSRRLLIDLENVGSYAKDLDRLYPPGDVVEQIAAEPDIELAVRFNTAKPDASILEVTSLDANSVVPKSGPGGVTLDIAGATLIISAAQSSNSNGGEPLSVGGATSSAPLFGRLDANQDGRLTIRELREVEQVISGLDRNTDGRISASEVPELVHVSIALGPIVHQYVNNFRFPGSGDYVPASSWFGRMDRNRDGDLSWGEFLGNREQFRSMDIDGDGLISQHEAFRGQHGEQQPSDRS